MTATHDSQEFMADGVIVHLKAGQLFTGRKALSEATGIPETTIERVLKTLESEHQIGQQKTSKYRVISILNWDKFQKRTAERTTNGQQTDTYKNVKNEKNLAANAVEYTVVTDSPTEKKITPEMKEVFAVFDDKPERVMFGTRVHLRSAATFLYKTYGIPELKKRYAAVKKHRDNPDCPQIDNPADFVTKMPKMERFLKNI
jgi:hypothetical protein